MKQTRYTVQHPVEFLSSLGMPFSAFLKEISCEVDAANQILKLSGSVQVDYKEYEKIISDGLFNTFSEANAIPEFERFNNESNELVEVELVLKRSVLKHFNESGKPPEAIINTLQSTLHRDEAQQYLRFTENWLATDFKQLMDLPAEFEDFGTLKQGYKTRWGDSAALQAEQMPSSPKAVVADFLAQKDLTYEWATDNIASLQFDTGTHKFSFLIAVMPDGQNVCCYSVYPERLPDVQRVTFAAFIAGINYDLPFGNFELDFEDGELRFRTALHIANRLLDVAALNDLVSINISEMVEHLPRFKAFQMAEV
ncbi:MAG: YbjN domain-containing protein [Cyanobacteria bacterium J06554_6]